MLNEDLARWLGYRFLDKPEVINGVSLAPGWWITPDGTSCEAELPDWEHSLDLIRRDLLPRLSDEQWWKLTDRITQQFDRSPHVRPYSRLFLTLPPADLAAAVWEVVK